MTHTLADIATICGVSKPAITQAVKRGNLIKGADGKIDDTNAVNKLYIEGKTGAVKRQVPKGVPTGSEKPKRKKSPDDTKADQELTKAVLAAQSKRQRRKKRKAEESMEGEVEDDPDADDDGDLEKLVEDLKKNGGQAGLLLKKLKTDIAYKEAATARYNLEMEVKKGNLVELSRLTNLVNKINKAMSDNIHTQHAKSGAMVFALATRDGATELDVTRKLELDYGQALKRTIEEITNAN